MLQKSLAEKKLWLSYLQHPAGQHFPHVGMHFSLYTLEVCWGWGVSLLSCKQPLQDPALQKDRISLCSELFLGFPAQQSALHHFICSCCCSARAITVERCPFKVFQLDLLNLSLIYFQTSVSPSHCPYTTANHSYCL